MASSLLVSNYHLPLWCFWHRTDCERMSGEIKKAKMCSKKLSLSFIHIILSPFFFSLLRLGAICLICTVFSSIGCYPSTLLSQSFRIYLLEKAPSIFRRIRKISEKRLRGSSCLSIYLPVSAYITAFPTGRISMKFGSKKLL
jgi:hypothetical protein